MLAQDIPVFFIIMMICFAIRIGNIVQEMNWNLSNLPDAKTSVIS
jgi:uncharacterized protein (DUF983 family)